MRHFKIYSGDKPSSADSATYFTMAYGDSRTNLAYYVIAPHTSVVALSGPTTSSASLNSSGYYSAQIKNPNQEDALFVGDLYFNGTYVRNMSYVIPAGQKAIITEQVTIVFGTNTVEIRNAQFKDVWHGLTTNSGVVTIGSATYRSPCNVTIPALQDGIASVVYTYTDGTTGYTTTTGASSSSKTIHVAYGTNVSFVATAKSTYYVDNNDSSTYSSSKRITGNTSMSTIYACYKPPTWGTFAVTSDSIVTAVINNTGVTIKNYTQRMTSSSYNTVYATWGPHTVANGATDRNTIRNLSSSTTYYFRAYAGAQGTIRQSRYITKSVTTSSSGSST